MKRLDLRRRSTASGDNSNGAKVGEDGSVGGMSYISAGEGISTCNALHSLRTRLDRSANRRPVVARRRWTSCNAVSSGVVGSIGGSILLEGSDSSCEALEFSRERLENRELKPNSMEGRRRPWRHEVSESTVLSRLEAAETCGACRADAKARCRAASSSSIPSGDCVLGGGVRDLQISVVLMVGGGSRRAPSLFVNEFNISKSMSVSSQILGSKGDGGLASSVPVQPSVSSGDGE